MEPFINKATEPSRCMPPALQGYLIMPIPWNGRYRWGGGGSGDIHIKTRSEIKYVHLSWFFLAALWLPL